VCADSIEALAAAMHVPAQAFMTEWREAERVKMAGGRDRFGRAFEPEHALVPPFHAVKVTGALFHTQGGLAVDMHARVKRKGGGLFPNLFAAGGAAAGVSGDTAAGYLSGNGLLTATTLGRIAGRAASALLAPIR
jgi:fumarate reductase flavoprotein subunit